MVAVLQEADLEAAQEELQEVEVAHHVEAGLAGFQVDFQVGFQVGEVVDGGQVLDPEAVGLVEVEDLKMCFAVSRRRPLYGVGKVPTCKIQEMSLPVYVRKSDLSRKTPLKSNMLYLQRGAQRCFSWKASCSGQG